jgi:hypothetical protein
MIGFLLPFPADTPRPPATAGNHAGFPTASRAAGQPCCCCRFSMRPRSGPRQSRSSLAISPS